MGKPTRRSAKPCRICSLSARLSVNVLWWRLAEGWETRPMAATAKGDAMVIPDALFEHRAVLHTKDRQPFSEVHGV
jgi:hypothetical protein